MISDIQLPDGDGMDFLRELKAAHPDLPVVISTGSADTGSGQSSRQ